MIDWKSIVNNAVSVLVATVFVGAATIMWIKVTTIEHTVGKYTTKLKANQDSLIDAQSELKASEVILTNDIVELHGKIELLDKQIRSLQQALKDIKQKKIVTYSIPENKPLIFSDIPKYKPFHDAVTKLKEKEDEKKKNNIREKIESLKPSYKSSYQKQLLQMQKEWQQWGH